MDPSAAYFIIVNGRGVAGSRRIGTGFSSLQRAAHALQFFRRVMPVRFHLSVEEVVSKTGRV